MTVSGLNARYEKGDALMLTCQASGGNPSQYVFEWLKGGVALPSETAQTLSISSLSGTDSGEYVCRAGNTKGDKDSASVTLNVLGEYLWHFHR